MDEASPDAYFARLPAIDLARCVVWKLREAASEKEGGEGGRGGEEDDELDAILQEQHNTDFKTEYGALPFWRLVILWDYGTEMSFTACFIFHHSLGGGATGAIFHTCFRQALDATISLPSMMADSSSLVTLDSGAQLLQPLEQLHPLPLNGNPKDYRTQKELKEWFGKPIHVPLITHYRTLYFSPACTAEFAKRCKESGFTVTCGLTAVLASALFSALPSTVEALTGIIPINLRPWLNLPAGSANGAMGSFIDAMKVQIRRSQYEDEDADGDQEKSKFRGLRAARHTAEEMKRYLTANASSSGEPYTSVAVFKSIPDIAAVFTSMLGSPRDAAFEISNLGRFESQSQSPRRGHDQGTDTDQETAQWRIGRMTFSRSAVAFGAAITTSVITGPDGGLSVGVCWQDGVVENSVVELVMQKFRQGVQSDSF